MLIKVENPGVFAKRMFFLLWEAIGHTTGAGALQDRPEATEDEVFQNVNTAGDYPGNMNRKEIYGDYVFGRMMKWGCKLQDDGVISIPDNEFRRDYQGFSHTYKNNKAIVEAASKSLEVSYELMPDEVVSA